MGIDIGGAFTINGVSGSQALKIAGASDAFVIDTAGRTYYPNQIGFIAGYNIDSGWWGFSADVWNAMTYFNNTIYNKGGGYSAGRFTAPVAGSYLFHWTSYHHKAGATQGHYLHPMFWVNGATVPSSYRLKGYFQPGGHSLDGEIADLYYLNAGDYVGVHIYSGAGGTAFNYMPYWSMFSGFLVG